MDIQRARSEGIEHSSGSGLISTNVEILLEKSAQKNPKKRQALLFHGDFERHTIRSQQARVNIFIVMCYSHQLTPSTKQTRNMAKTTEDALWIPKPLEVNIRDYGWKLKDAGKPPRRAAVTFLPFTRL